MPEYCNTCEASQNSSARHPHWSLVCEAIDALFEIRDLHDLLVIAQENCTETSNFDRIILLLNLYIKEQEGLFNRLWETLDELNKCCQEQRSEVAINE